MIPSWTRHYVSTPYDQVNCWGLVKLVYKEMYSIELTDMDEQKDMIKSGFWVEVADNFQTGDVMVFRTTEHIKHVAICLDEEFMLHSDRGCGSVIERWPARHWLPRLRGVYRCKLIS